jgi:glutamate-5-semialdehyde dehydrogenase
MSRLEPLQALVAGERILVGGSHCVVVTPELARAFEPGDRLVVVHATGDLLHVPAAEHARATAAVGEARRAFGELAAVDDAAISAFFDVFAARLADDATFAPVAAANRDDVALARSRGRATGRLVLGERMRADMVAGLRAWRDSPARRRQRVDEVRHAAWTVEQWRDPLGVVGFVFEGRPNVFADATGVLRTGNTVVFRIGSDALATARAIMAQAVLPALDTAGLPAGCVQLLDSTAHAGGWALFADARLSLAVARGSGAAVAQLGAVARQHGVPASLHGTGGAWLVAAECADAARFELAVRHSLDRKVCNTLNVCCIVRARAADLLPRFHAAVAAAGAARGVTPVVHELAPGDAALAHEWEWDEVPELALVVVDDVAQAVAECNRASPRFIASLIASDAALHDWFYASVEAPFVGDGFTRWVDGQFALLKPELGLSNWQGGRLLARGGVLSGDSIHTLRLRARVGDADLHR